MYDGFVELIRDDDGARVYVNPHQVAYFEPYGTGTKLYFSMEAFVVRELLHEVWDLFSTPDDCV